MHFQQVSPSMVAKSSASTGSLHSDMHHRRSDFGLHIEPRRGQPVRKCNHGSEGAPGSPSSALLPFPCSSSSEGVPSPQHPLHRPPELQVDGSCLRPSSGDSFSGEFPFYSDSSPQYSPHQRTNYSPGHTPPRVGPTGPSEKGPSRFFQQEGNGYRDQGREVRTGVSDREMGAGKAHKREVKKGVSVQERPSGVPSPLFVHPQVYASSFPCTQEGATGCWGYQGQSKLVKSLSSDESEGSDGEERYGTKGRSGVQGYTSGAPAPPFPPHPVPLSAGPWSYDSASEEEEGGETKGPVHAPSPATQNPTGRGSGLKLRRSLSDDSDEDETPVCPRSSRPVGPRGAPQRGSPPEKLSRNFLEDEMGSPGAHKGVGVKGPGQVRSPPTKLERKISDDEETQKPIKGEERRVGVRVRSPPQKKLERKLLEDELMFDGPTTAAVGDVSTSKPRPPKKLERSLSDDDDEEESTVTPTKDPQRRKARSPMPCAPQTSLEGMPMWPYAAPEKPRENTLQRKKVLERSLDDDDVPSAVRKPVKHKVVPASGVANSGLMTLVGNDGTSEKAVNAVRRPMQAKPPSPLAVPDNNNNSGPVKVQRDLLEDEAPLVVKQVRQVKQVAGQPLNANSYKSRRKMQRDMCADDMPRPHRPGRKQVKGAVGVGVGPTSGAHQYSQSCRALLKGVPQRLGSEERSSSPGGIEPSKMRKARVRPSQQAPASGRGAGQQRIEWRLSDD